MNANERNAVIDECIADLQQQRIRRSDPSDLGLMVALGRIERLRLQRTPEAAPAPPKDLGPFANCSRCHGTGEESNAQFRCPCRWSDSSLRKPAEAAAPPVERPQLNEEEVIQGVVDHWFIQGGHAEFGEIGHPQNSDELIAAILGRVRGLKIPASPAPAPRWTKQDVDHAADWVGMYWSNHHDLEGMLRAYAALLPAETKET